MPCLRILARFGVCPAWGTEPDLGYALPEEPSRIWGMPWLGHRWEGIKAVALEATGSTEDSVLETFRFD